MTDHLVEFLRSRLDEEEEYANAATHAGLGIDVANGHVTSDDPNIQDHFATWHPGRVRREVEAKRRLLEQFRLRGDSVRATVKPATGGVWDDLLRLLALPYADHPDYREEWRP